MCGVSEKVPQAIIDAYRLILKEKVAFEACKAGHNKYYLWSRGSDDSKDNYWAELNEYGAHYITRPFRYIKWAISETIGVGIINPRATLPIMKGVKK